jgi:hypothetical protein
MLAAAVNDHLFWITSRAAGTLALLFSSVGVGAGLLMGGKLLKRRGPDLRTAHEALSIATIVAIAVHAVAFLGLVHSLGEGTDAGTAWFLVATALVAIPAAALLVARMTRPAPRAVAR